MVPPAGTVLHLIGIHDNTSANRRNPDPNMWIGFGERSVDAKPSSSSTAQPQP